jgi:hypothetical protein
MRFFRFFATFARLSSRLLESALPEAGAAPATRRRRSLLMATSSSRRRRTARAIRRAALSTSDSGGTSVTPWKKLIASRSRRHATRRSWTVRVLGFFATSAASFSVRRKRSSSHSWA